MSKKPVKTSADDKEKKVTTKYDRKMAKRREEARKARRNRIITKIVVTICLVAAATAIIVTSVININRIFREYIKVDGKNMSQIEFDFYYGITKNSELSAPLFSSMTYLDYYESYLGYDSTKKDEKQEYSSELTWYDHFASRATDSIKEYRALLKAADEAGFEYTTWEEDYKEFETGMEDSAEEADMSVSKYYKQMFGKYATKSRVKSYVKDYFKATAYYDSLVEEMKPSDDEIKEYYQENKEDYDLFNYRRFTIKSEDMQDGSIETAKSKADEFASECTDENSFIELCKKYAPEDDETYEKDEASLVKDDTKNYFEEYAYADWLLDERKEGDITVVKDEDHSCAYVVFFKSRVEDEDAGEEISDVLVNKAYSEFIAKYTDEISVDVNKRFKY